MALFTWVQSPFCHFLKLCVRVPSDVWPNTRICETGMMAPTSQGSVDSDEAVDGKSLGPEEATRAARVRRPCGS